MPSEKTLARKQEIIDDIANNLKDAKSIVLYSYQGITVDQDTQMRRAFREAGVSYHVVKNSYALRAFEKLGIEGTEPMLVGPVALAYSTEDVVFAPRLCKKFVDEYKVTAIKGGIIDHKAVELDLINRLADLPSKDVLYSQMCFGVLGPVTKMAMTLAAMVKKAEEQGLQDFSTMQGEKSAAAAPAEPAAEPAAEAAPSAE